MIAPFAGGDLLGDQCIGGVGIGDTQQRFGEAHEGEAFGIREAELLQEAFHDAGVLRLGARFQHDVAGGGGGGAALHRVERGLGQHFGDALRFVLELSGIEHVGGRQAGRLGLRHVRDSCQERQICR